MIEPSDYGVKRIREMLATDPTDTIGRTIDPSIVAELLGILERQTQEIEEWRKLALGRGVRLVQCQETVIALLNVMVCPLEDAKGDRDV